MEKRAAPAPERHETAHPEEGSCKDIRIFVSHRIDRESARIDNPLYVPVRCGAVYDKRENPPIPGDDTGENISERRDTFNELTVQYWAWKNVRADYYGLCHYRRYLAFSEHPLCPDPHENAVFPALDAESIAQCGLRDSGRMRAIIEENDLLVSVPYDVSKRGFRNLYEHYAEVPWQHKRDLKKVLPIIGRLHPDYLEPAKSYLNGVFFYPCNLFIMKADIFFEYCSWLFPILFELERSVPAGRYGEKRKRVCGFAGERLLGVFITGYLKKHPACRYRELQRAFFLQTAPEGTGGPPETAPPKFQRAAEFAKGRLKRGGRLYKYLSRLYQFFK